MRQVILWGALAALILSLVPAALAQEDLTESFTSESGAISLQYPAGWTVAESFGQVSGGNFDYDVENGPGDLNGDQAIFQVFDPTFLGFLAEGVDFSTLEGPEAIAALGAALTADSSEPVTLGEPTTETINGVEVYYLNVADDVNAGVLVMIPDGNGSYLVLIGIGTPSNFELSQATILAIAASLTYDAAAAEAAGFSGSDFGADFATEFDPATFPQPEAGEAPVVWSLTTPSSFDLSGLGSVNGLVVTPEGDILIAEAQVGLARFNSDGVLQESIALPSDVFSIVAPSLGPDGTIWAVTSFGYEVVQLNLDGTLVQRFGEEGTGEGQFSNPGPVRVGPDGTVYVYDYVSLDDGSIRAEIDRFDASGNYLGSILITDDNTSGFGVFDLPFALLPDGNLILASFMGFRIIDPEGNIVADELGMAEIGFAVFTHMTTDAEGNIYGAAGNGVWKLGPDGSVLGRFGDSEVDFGGELGVAEFSYPTGIALMPDGSIVVSDSNFEFVRLTRFELK
jgi:hypothetical protein